MASEIDLKLYQLLLRSYYTCIKNKPRFKRSKFHLNHESEIYRLTQEIREGRYKPAVSTVFVVTRPKPREIIAAHIRDRIVHHMIYDYMAPYWEKRFSPRSYACRVGKGSLQAVKDLRKFMQRYKRSTSKPLYYLRLDIQSFFASIDSRILLSIIEKKLSNPLYLGLVKVTLAHRATHKGNYILRSPRELWTLVPKYKSLFFQPDHLGIPIGNLTSQFFANVYLNEFDQFLTHVIKPLYWQRYVDDVVILSDNPKELVSYIEKSDEFLQSKLSIKINRKKIVLQPVSKGIDHLGYFVKASHVRIRRNIVTAFKQRFAAFAFDGYTICPHKFHAMANSYLGYFKHANSRSLRFKITRIVEACVPLSHHLKGNPKAEKLIFCQDEKIKQQRLAKELEYKNAFITSLPAWCSKKHMYRVYERSWKPMSDISF